MAKTLAWSIIGIIISIVGIIFGVVIFPVFMGAWAICSIIGLIIIIISLILFIVNAKINTIWLKTAKLSCLLVGIGLFALPAIVIASILLANNFANRYVSAKTSETAVETTAETTVENTTATREETVETKITIYSSGQVDQTTENAIKLFIVNPEDPSQAQIEHPSIYTETHISGNPVVMTFDIPDGYVGIVGGFTVNDENNGSYKAFGPGTYIFTVTDGFGLITTKEWAKGEWNFRLDQCQKYGWACSNIDSGPIN